MLYIRCALAPRCASAGARRSRALCCRNLPFNITAEEMYDIFGKYGAVRQIRLYVPRAAARASAHAAKTPSRGARQLPPCHGAAGAQCGPHANPKNHCAARSRRGRPAGRKSAGCLKA